MNPITRTTVLALAVLGLALAPAAEAAKPVKVSKARFAVTIDGVQNTTWSSNHQAAGIGGCDGSYTAGGSEKVRFTSKPASIRAMSITGLSAPVLSTGRGGNTRSPKIKLHGSVTRNSFHNAAPGPDTGCGGPDKPQQPLAKDCGVKKFRGLVTSFDYQLASKVRDTLNVNATEGEDPFQRCSGGGVSFPTLANKNKGRPMDLRLPRRELFDRKLGKIILIGRAREEKRDGEYQYLTTTKWVITMVRK